MVVVNYWGTTEPVICRTLLDVDLAIRKVRYGKEYIHSMIYLEPRVLYNIVYIFDDHYDFTQELGYEVPNAARRIKAEGGKLQHIIQAHTLDARTRIQWEVTPME